MNYLDELACNIDYNFDMLDDEGCVKPPHLWKPVYIEAALPKRDGGYEWEWICRGTRVSLLAKGCIDVAESIHRNAGKNTATFCIRLANNDGTPRKNSYAYMLYANMHEFNGECAVRIIDDPSCRTANPTIRHFVDYLWDACNARNRQICARTALTQSA